MWTYAVAILGSAAIFLGAFGAHGLEDKVSPEKLANWNTAAVYHLVHVVALLALVLYGRATDRSISLTASLWSGGILAFSGSIYLLVLGAPKAFGPITPLGGLALAAGWISLITLSR